MIMSLTVLGCHFQHPKQESKMGRPDVTLESLPAVPPRNPDDSLFLSDRVEQAGPQTILFSAYGEDQSLENPESLALLRIVEDHFDGAGHHAVRESTIRSRKCATSMADRFPALSTPHAPGGLWTVASTAGRRDDGRSQGRDVVPGQTSPREHSIPRRSIRERSVEGFIPSISAAPPRPLIRPPATSSARRICRR